MKKLLYVVLALLGIGMQTACADNDRPITTDQLPAKALTFLGEQFPNDAVSYATMDKELFSTTYEVVLASGTRVEFLSNGEWSEIDCLHNALPEVVVPQPIREQVAQRFPDRVMTEIKRERGRHEVTISGGLELKFDARNQLVEIDD